MFLLRYTNTHTLSTTGARLFVCVCAFYTIQLNFEWNNTVSVDVYVSIRVCMYECTHTTVSLPFGQCEQANLFSLVYIHCACYPVHTHLNGVRLPYSCLTADCLTFRKPYDSARLHIHRYIHIKVHQQCHTYTSIERE